MVGMGQQTISDPFRPFWTLVGHCGPFLVLDVYWRSPECGGVWYKSRQIRKMIRSPLAAQPHLRLLLPVATRLLLLLFYPQAEASADGPRVPVAARRSSCPHTYHHPPSKRDHITVSSPVLLRREELTSTSFAGWPNGESSSLRRTGMMEPKP